jgi:hypothetical protein
MARSWLGGKSKPEPEPEPERGQTPEIETTSPSPTSTHQSYKVDKDGNPHSYVTCYCKVTTGDHAR